MSIATVIGTALLSGKAASIVSTVSTDLIIGTITTSTKAIGSMLTYLASSEQNGIKDVISIIKSTDLEFTISIIEQVVKEQENKTLPDSVKKALIGVNDILDMIHKELDNIKNAVEYHNTKYFNTWRSFSCDCNMETIKSHNELLNHRYSILIELIKINNK